MKVSRFSTTDQKLCRRNLFCKNRSAVQTRVSLKQREVHVSDPECETLVSQTRISAPKREVCILSPKRETYVRSAPKYETRVLPIPEHDSHISNTKREVPILTPREVRVSTKKHKVHIQIGMSLRHTEPKSPHPMGSSLVLHMPKQRI